MKRYALNFTEDGEEAKIAEDIKKQSEEKQNIARESREQKIKAARENAPLVEKIKSQIQISQKQPPKGKEPVLALLNTISLAIIIALGVVLLLRWWHRNK